MVKYVLLTILELVILFSPVEGLAASYQAYEATSGSRLTVTDVSQKIKNYDVVVFGEYHDNQVLHRLEADLLTAVYERYPNVAISLEMFERDKQQLLNAYLSGRVSEAAFLEQARPWPNYGSDYRPLIEFAKEEGLRVLAANIPRSMAAYYARRGTLDGIDEAMLSYLPRTHRAPDGEYRTLFLAQMQAMSNTHSAMPVTAGQMEAF